MDKAEQPTIAQADREAAEAVYPAFLASLRGEDGGYGLAEAFARHRTTSLAAQDDWTTKRVAELVAEGYGHWRSCTGCHETNEGAETGDYPFNPVFKTYQGGGCGECGGIGVVWDDIDYADYAEFCLNADDDAPSLAAQDGLDDHFPSGLRQRSHQIATAGDVVDGPVCVDCHCGASFSATDEGEARQLWASHAMAAMERPKTAAQDGLVEAVAEALLSAFLAGRGSVTADGRKAYKPAPSMADFRNIALSAIKEQHHD